MVKVIKEEMMRLAMQEAQIAADEGNFPFGAILAEDSGQVFAQAHNSQETSFDPTAHAEINLIRQVYKIKPDFNFGSYWLICNAESCSMCFSAAIKVGIEKFIFGAPSEPHMDPYLTVNEIAAFCHRQPVIISGILLTSCKDQILRIRLSQQKLAQ